MGSYITLGNAFAFFGFLIGAVIVPIIIVIIAKKNSNYVNSLNISFGEIEKKLKDIEEFKKEIKADIKIDINRIYDQIEEIRKGIYKKIEESNKQIIEEFKEFCALNQRGCNKSIETKIDNTNSGTNLVL